MTASLQRDTDRLRSCPCGRKWSRGSERYPHLTGFGAPLPVRFV